MCELTDECVNRVRLLPGPVQQLRCMWPWPRRELGPTALRVSCDQITQALLTGKSVQKRHHIKNIERGCADEIQMVEEKD